MKEHPIPFTGAMVRAILDGRKTQTRRVIKPQPEWRDGAWYWTHPRYDNGAGVRYFHSEYIGPSLYKRMVRCCPYGVPGDRLWMRERHHLTIIEGPCAGNSFATFPDGGQKYKDGAYYRPGQGLSTEGLKWRPPMFMPRWACRTVLELVDVGVERLQELTPADAIAEGIPVRATPMTIDCDTPDPRIEFRSLWDSLNAKRGYGWDVNPWVWVLEFRRLEEARKAA